MSVGFGSPSTSANFNAAFVSRTQDTNTTGVVSLDNTTDPDSGASVDNVQQAVNETFDAVGMTGIDDANRKIYSSNNVIANGDNRKVALGKVDAKFNASTGHAHTGAAGQGAPISAANLSNFNNYFASFQSFTVTGASGTSATITTQMTGKVVYSSTVGVPTSSPNNLVHIVNTSTKTFLEDAGGQKVFGRITESGGVWTLTYYTNEAGVETSTTLSSTNITCIFVEVFTAATRPVFPSNPLEFGTLDVTGDVVDASTSVRGVVTTGTQTFGGAKSFNDGVIALASLSGSVQTDSSTTGVGQTLSTPTKYIYRVTNASLSSIAGISAPSTAMFFILANKTGVTISILNTDSSNQSILTGTGADLEVASNASVMIAYDTTSSRWFIVGGSGSGSGTSSEINYIENGNFETNGDGWVAYADAAGTSPVDGTGGSPNVLVSFTTVAINVLRGVGSIALNKNGASNRQGQGMSYDFTIDPADKAKMLQISFDHRVDDSGFVAGATGVDSSVTVWIYDVTNSVLIQPSTYKLFSNSTTISNQFISNFQTAPNSVAYRLILHIGSTDTVNYHLTIDNVKIAPTTLAYGTPISDWESMSVTASAGFGTTTNVSYWKRRVGSELQVRGYHTNGTLAGSVCYIPLPTGLSIDTTKIKANSDTTQGQVVGHWGVDNQGNANGYMVTATTTSALRVYAADIYASATCLTPTASGANISGNNDNFSFEFSVPIAGWSSQVQMSDISDQRIVAAKYSIASGVTSDASNPFDFATKIFDTHSAVTAGSTWKFTAPVPGLYEISSLMYLGANTEEISLYKNGTVDTYLFYHPNGSPGCGTTTINLNAGDYIDLRSITSATTATPTASTGIMSISIRRIANPAMISATELISARYYNSSTSISGSLATIVWTTKDYDSHGAVASGVFTCPAPGKYQFNLAAALSGTFVLNNTTVIEFQKNGTAVSAVTHYIAASVTNEHVQLSDVIQCLAGDTLRVQISSSGTGPAFVSSNTKNFLSIFRVGL